MSSLKFINPADWTRIEQHLAAARGERFAFALTKTLHNDDDSGPVLEVVDVVLIEDNDTEHADHGWSITSRALDRVHNQAVATGHGLVEFHNHRLGPPGFSRIDETALKPMVQYMLELLPGTPYGAAVWAQGRVQADWWRTDGGRTNRGTFRTVTVGGLHLRVLNARTVSDGRLARQLPLLGHETQAAIAALRVAVVGAGGTGSHAVLNLAYLGFQDLLLLDDDTVEASNLNRLVTAEQADIYSPKTTVARRRIRAIDPRIQVRVMSGLSATGSHPALYDVDLIIGCVDHDGPRQRLNQIAVDTRTPYIDIATGVDDSHQPTALGGRVILVQPQAPCLTCLGELDSAEIARWAKPANQRELDRQHGYGTSTPNPSVVHLNGLAVNAALTELIAWLTGARPPAAWLDIDLLGDRRQSGMQIGPRQVGKPDPNCIDCGSSTT